MPCARDTVSSHSCARVASQPPSILVQANKHRDGCQSGQAASQRVDSSLSVHTRCFQLQLLWVILVARLQIPNTRLQGLHGNGRFHLRFAQWIGSNLDNHREQNDGKAIAVRDIELLKTTVQHLEKRLKPVCKPSKPPIILVRWSELQSLLRKRCPGTTHTPVPLVPQPWQPLLLPVWRSLSHPPA